MTASTDHLARPQIVKGTIKWYRQDKGFGFLASPDVADDIFIHFSVVEHYGRETLDTGDLVTCTIGPSQRGLQALKILAVEHNSAPQQQPESIQEVLDGALKWYSPKKGFGFIAPDDQRGDIFLHISVLRKLGCDNLEPGTRLKAECAHSPRGREAVNITILS